MADNYEIYYGNGLKEGVEEAAAVAALAKLLKLSEEAASGIVRRTDRIIKSGLNEAQAERYRSLLDGVGLQVEIREALATEYDTGYEPTQVIAAVKPAPEAEPPEPPQPPQQPPQPPSGREDAGFSDDAEPREYPVLFHGKGFEYFKIWIVNVLLSILTLGIYSAWAKVRNKQYFYGNTEIDGSSFRYTAKPLQILKGRIIAFVLFLVYLGINQVFPPAGIVLLLVFLIFLPWIVIRSLAFNARNSMYRNIRFRFTGSVGEAVMAFIVAPLLAAVTIGLMAPYAWYRQTRFYVNNHSFGTTAFDFDSGVGPYFKLMFKLLGLGVGAIIMIGVLAALNGPPSEASGSPVASLLLPAVVLIFYVLAFALIESGLGNLRFNNSRLDEVYFNSSLTMKGMASLYLVNTLGVVLSLGLLIPWAKVRTAAYRARCLTLVAPGLDGFVAAEEEKVSALGEQIGEVFDVDILGV